MSGKTNGLLNLINHQLGIDKIHLHAKDAKYETKYEFLINKLDKVGLKHYNDPKAFIENSNYKQDSYKDIAEYKSEKTKKNQISDSL